jgi:hypothetical protein
MVDAAEGGTVMDSVLPEASEREHLAMAVFEPVILRLSRAAMHLQGLHAHVPDDGGGHQRIDDVVSAIDEAIRALRRTLAGADHPAPPPE